MLLGGHRGMGENLSTKDPNGKRVVFPAVRENTIQSFLKAAKCGVKFVEFDVQVTRDGIPILWHDDQVVHGAADHPAKPEVKDLSLAELQALCRPAHTRPPSSIDVASDDGLDGISVDGGSVDGEPRLLRIFRDRTTRVWEDHYEPWLCAEDDAIPTLDAVFRALPEDVGFDIEVKMTTGDDVVHTPAAEVSRMLNAILPVVERYTNPSAPASADTPTTSAPNTFGSASTAGRRVIFSSFDPDVCVELTRRRVPHPVYYLSGCGLYEHADPRRTSIPAALSFARETGMRGIVMPASVLMANLGDVTGACGRELEVMTYGIENSEVEVLRAQADAGVAAAIVDDVQGVTDALKGAEGAL